MRILTLRSIGALAALSLAYSSNAAAVEILTNGSFETGDLTGWTTSGVPGIGPCPSEPQDWNVSTTGFATQCSMVGAPVDGSFAAYVMNDGFADTVYELSQSFVVPAGIASASLSWQDSSVSSYGGAPRTLSVDFFDGATLVANVFGLVIPFDDTDASWTPRAEDVTAILAANDGSTLTLRFTNSIPELWTGPAGLGLDQVSLSFTPIPVPAALWLFGSALGLLGWLKRRSN